MGRRLIVVALAAIAVVAGAWLLSGGSGRGGLRVSRVAGRVAQIRGLRFARLPTVHLVGQEEMHAVVARELPTRELGPAASDFTGRVPAGVVSAVERLEALELLGAVPVGTTMLQVLVGGAQDPGGLFQPHRGEVCIRRGSGLGLGGAESVLAHELTHAVEYQSHLHGPERVGGFEQLETERALIEGPAVLVQYLYARRYLGFREALSRFVELFSQEAQRALDLPRVLLADAVFPYVDGALFAERLRNAGGWGAVTQAERTPPSTTRPLLIANPQAGSTPKFDVARSLRGGWRPGPRQTLGDYDSAVLLTSGSLTPSAAFVRGWRGGSLQVWNDLTASKVARCRRPCAPHFVLVISWRWATAATDEAAARDLRRLLAPVLNSSGQQRPALRTRLGSAVAITATRQFTTIALAPHPAMADAAVAANRLPTH